MKENNTEYELLLNLILKEEIAKVVQGQREVIAQRARKRLSTMSDEDAAHYLSKHKQERQQGEEWEGTTQTS